MKRKIIALSICILLVVIASLIFVNWKNPNVVASFEEVSVGDKLTGNLVLTIEEKDNLSADTPLIFSITKGNKVKYVKTLTLEEFEDLAGVEENNYKAGTYTVPITSLADFKFEEKGEYELFFSMPKIDYVVRRDLRVN